MTPCDRSFRRSQPDHRPEFARRALSTHPNKHGLLISGFSQVRDVFHYCALHGKELQSDRVPVIFGIPAAPSDPGMVEANREYPYANDVDLPQQ